MSRVKITPAMIAQNVRRFPKPHDPTRGHKTVATRLANDLMRVCEWYEARDASGTPNRTKRGEMNEKMAYLAHRAMQVLRRRR